MGLFIICGGGRIPGGGGLIGGCIIGIGGAGPGLRPGLIILPGGPPLLGIPRIIGGGGIGGPLGGKGPIIGGNIDGLGNGGLLLNVLRGMPLLPLFIPLLDPRPRTGATILLNI